MKRRAVILLTVSLVANVFLIGAIAGGVWRWTHYPGPGFRGGWRMHVADSLPDAQARSLRQVIDATIAQSQPTVQRSRAARAEAARLFVQPRFDGRVIATRLDQARAADTFLRRRLEQRIIQFAATLPQDQRRKMAEALKAGPFRQDRHLR